ncbi:O-linked N-acetylglucosamine transferase family protein [Candidatus Pelagibacter sp. HIMB1517]|uniref:O-linked N-acetylglucosamine transferase family protein n=1 Tax=Candidatus Pelagibacter sp. HIMB1517 TaxID=3413341 RepID=UPI003F8385BD
MSDAKLEKSKKHFLESLTFIENKNYQKAEALLLKSYNLVDDRISIITNLILINVLQKKYKEAIKYINIAYKKFGKNIDIINRHAHLRFQQKKFYKSLLIGLYGLKIDKNNDELNFNLSVLYKNFGNYEKSIFYLKSCKKLNKKKYLTNLIFLNDFIPNRNEEEYTKIIKEYEGYFKKELNTFSIINPNKSKISIISGELKNHAVAHQIKDVIKHLSNNYEINIFNHTDINDDITKEIKNYASNWIDTDNMNNSELISNIKKTSSKYIFSLSGFNKNNKTEIFKNRICPIQINWCGHLTTSGIENMDFILGDPYCTPKEMQRYYTENILNMPEIWTVLSKPQEVQHKDYLPCEKNNFVTFGCFNRFAKINMTLLNTWSEILSKNDNSKIHLISTEFNDEIFKKKITNFFTQKGIEKENLKFTGNVNRTSLLNAYNNIDIVLDTYPYTGGTTTLEAIYMERPVLTIYGKSFLTRCGLSINKNIKMDNWVCEDIIEYKNKAIQYSKDIDFLVKEKNRIKNNKLSSPLYDSKRFSNNLSNILKSL